ncbi:glycosyltransferase [Paenibacillus sp. IHB B 3415]|uniref:glycosyltransferase family 2 protein n=1 Tax=Paenibacillus sp. IHB B 3415 TaxID=867080 RepID=UPI00069990E8|nr:glycosyltransferase [Paenibacillus sp. IHB B 3415]
MESVISIIIPIYNVEHFIVKCIESIIHQTYKNLEIILVNDGSPDNCGRICDDYAFQDNRIKVIHKKNGGLSSARNAGLDVATGNYIGFVDSDDWVEFDMFEKLLNVAEQENADIVQCGYRSVSENGGVLRKYTGLNESYNNNEDVLEAYFAQTKINVVVWNKLYKRHLFDSIRMVEGRLFEDTMVSFELVLHTKKLVSIEGEYYNYLQRSSSIMGSTYTSQKLDMIYAGNYVLSKCKISVPQYINQAHILLCMYCVYLYYDLNYSNIQNQLNHRKTILIEFANHYEIVKHSEEFKKTRIKNKILIKSFSLNKTLAIIIYRLYSILKKM